jgi:S1-C subfamily serine protease
LLVKLGNTAIIDEDHLAAFLEDRKPGEKVSCALVRGGKSLRYTVVLAARADTDQPVSKFSLRWNAGVALNAQLEELTPQMRSYFGVRNGVLIKQVDAGGAAARAGLRAGDVLTAIAGDPVNSLIGRYHRAVQFTPGRKGARHHQPQGRRAQGGP